MISRMQSAPQARASDDLIEVVDEILAQNGQGGRGARDLQYAEAALE